jgi:zinc D-Ala-D-Ala carboxypeptidase
MEQITLNHFSLSEFASPDLAGSGQYMQLKCLLMLDQARELAQIPFIVTSGFRTQKYHDSLTKRGFETAKNSPHLLGQAADISYATGKELATIINAAILVGFTSIGISKNFVHLDTRDRKVVWFYKNTPFSTIQKYRNLF